MFEPQRIEALQRESQQLLGRYYMQASRSELQPRIKRLIEYLLGESGAADGPRDDKSDEPRAKTGEAAATHYARRPAPGARRFAAIKAQDRRFSPVLVPKFGRSRRPPWKQSSRFAGSSASGETRTRTGDTTIFSRVLYQLSYLAVRLRG